MYPNRVYIPFLLVLFLYYAIKHSQVYSLQILSLLRHNDWQSIKTVDLGSQGVILMHVDHKLVQMIYIANLT